MSAQPLNGKCLFNNDYNNPVYSCVTVTDGSGEYVDVTACLANTRDAWAFMYGFACVKLSYCGTDPSFFATCDACKAAYSWADPICL